MTPMRETMPAPDRGRILVIDDEEEIRESLEALLDFEGYDVDLAQSGAEGERRLEQRAYDLVLLDLMMPEMDGSQFRAVQMNDPRLSKIPVVVLSADRMIAEKAHALGVWGFVVKPLKPAQLVSIIERSTH
jgi:CheY-like chemotaxis protein